MKLNRIKLVAIFLLMAMAISGFSVSAAAQTQRATIYATSVRLGNATLYLGKDGVGTSDLIRYRILPENASANANASLRYWSSDDPSIATVSAAGLVKATGLGTTYINLHIEDGSAKGARCKVTVKRQVPTAIKLNETRLVRLPGTIYQLTATVTPMNAYDKSVIWQSSNKKIAAVTSKGLVKCYKPGTVQITGRTKYGNAKASCTFIVGYDFEKSNFRAITIVNSDYPDSIGKLPMVQPSAEAVHAHFRAMYEDGYAKVCKGYRNQTGAEIRQILTEMANNKNTTNSDVTIFYFSGRGEVSSSANQRGALLGVDADKPSGVVTIAEIQKQLDKIPGIVLLILDSQMAGQFIASKGASQADALAFNRAVNEQFASSTATNFDAKAISGAQRTKYKILAATSARGRIYGVWNEAEEDGYSFFSRALARALEGDGDYNKDSIITLREAFHYTKAKVKSDVAAYNKQHNKNWSQVVTVWPSNDYSPVCVVTEGDDLLDF